MMDENTIHEIRNAAQEYANDNLTEGAVYGSSNIANAFAQGAKWAMEQQQNKLYSALKGLGLDKHSIALNVLRIAGIELPKL